MAIRIRKKQQRSTTGLHYQKSPQELIEIAKQNGIETEPLDLTSLCQILNLGIKFMPLESELSGYLEHDGYRWVICVNALHHPRRQRFTLAHELAHYFLHRDEHNQIIEEVRFHRGKQYDTKELEADNFAGALLMPKSEFVRFVSENSNKIDDIAEHFGTSGIAVKKRADVIRSNAYEF